MGRHEKTRRGVSGSGHTEGRIGRRALLSALGAASVVAVGAGAGVSLRSDRAARSGSPVAVSGAPVVPGTRYFVSPDGDDDAPGTDPASPWQTIDGVNRRMDDGTIGPGDAVVFRSGSTFFGKIRPAAFDLDRYPTGRLVLSAYGGDASADRPVISSYKLLDVADGWRRSGPEEWSIDLSPAAFGTTHHGYSGAQGGSDNIGFLRADGVLHGRRVAARGDLAQPWDFCCTGPLLYVRSADNPSRAAADLRAACGETCIALTDGLEVRGLRVEGGGGHGAQGTARSVRISDNEFAELGGSMLGPDARYGNGVEIWIGSSDVEVSRNIVHDVYDVALTVQGDRSDDATGWANVSITENLVYRCSQSVEFWSSGSSRGATGFTRCTAEGNICLLAGQGWAGGVRPDQDTRVHLLTYGWTLPADIRVTGNVFHDAVSGYRFSSAPTPGLVTEANIIRLRAGAELANTSPEPIEAGTAWSARTRTEAGSSFTVLTADQASPDVGTVLRELRGDEAVARNEATRSLLDLYASRYP